MKPEEINRKMVEAALIMKQINGDISQTIPRDVDLKHVYCARYNHSVIDGIHPDMYRSDLNSGDGGELGNEPGFAPKFNSISSSASMAVSTFAPWKERLSQLSIELGSLRFSGFESLEFEHIAKTAIPNARKHPNLDVWLESENAVLAVECKFCEYLTEKNEKTSLVDAYKWLAATMNQNNPWIRAIDLVIDKNGKCKYSYFDAVQIIRHYFGVLNSSRKEKHLLYLYWHPDNEDWMEILPFNRLMKELMEFSKLLSQATDVHFHYLSIDEIWDKWAHNSITQVQDHVSALKKKYSIKINITQENNKKEQIMLNKTNEIRTKDFKLFDDNHGITPTKPENEQSMSRHLYWSKKPLLLEHLGKRLHIKLIGYEIPLGTNTHNQYFIDLLGMDQDHNLYIIEVKKYNSSQKPSKVISDQINIYLDKLKKSLPFLEKELNQHEGYEETKVNNILKILLAEESYYYKHKLDLEKNKSDVILCHFKTKEKYIGIDSIADEDGTIPLCIYEHD